MLRTSSGVTLFELLIATAISLSLIIAMTSAYLVSTRVFSGEITRSDVLWEEQKAAERMTKEIRESLEVTSAEAGRISFWWKDLNANGSKETNEIVSYALSGQSLTRTIGSSSQIVANQITRLTLAYNVIPGPNLVTISITASGEGEVSSIESKARIRNE